MESYNSETVFLPLCQVEHRMNLVTLKIVTVSEDSLKLWEVVIPLHILCIAFRGLYKIVLVTGLIKPQIHLAEMLHSGGE